MNKYLCIVQIIGTDEDDEDKKIRNAFMTVCSTDGMDDQLTFDPNWSDLALGRQFTPLGHIILISNQPVFALSS
jgi:hypothetical protein